MQVPTKEQQRILHRIHEERLRAHWGKNYDVSQAPWPKSDADWRQTSHGAPWDTNVTMAQWHQQFSTNLKLLGLI